MKESMIRTRDIRPGMVLLMPWGDDGRTKMEVSSVYRARPGRGIRGAGYSVTWTDGTGTLFGLSGVVTVAGELPNGVQSVSHVDPRIIVGALVTRRGGELDDLGRIHEIKNGKARIGWKYSDETWTSVNDLYLEQEAARKDFVR